MSIHELNDRVTRLEATFETELKHLATRVDISDLSKEISEKSTSVSLEISDLKSWILIRFIICVAAGVGLLFAVIEYFTK